MSRPGALLRACHPEPTAAVTATVTAFAVSAGHRPGRAALVGAAVLAGQLSVGWSNDWVDRARDGAAGRSDKPVARGELPAPVVRSAAFAALGACGPLSLAVGRPAGAAHLTGVAAAWGYNFGLKGSALSVGPYAVGFGLLPAFVSLGLPGAPRPPWWAPTAGALLGAGAHFANALPDLAEDERAGVRGLPHRLGAARSTAAAAVLMTGASAVLAIGPPGPPGPLGVAGLVGPAGLLAGGLLAGRRRPGSRAAFRSTLAVAILDVALLLARGRTLA